MYWERFTSTVSRGFRRGTPRREPRSVVYTCHFGDYEELTEQPVAERSKIDFVCFTDRTDLRSKTWQVRTVHTLGIGSARESRRPKLMPHLYLGEYDQSCYLDGSLLLTAAPEELFETLSGQQTDFVCIKHPLRDCIFNEAEEIIRGSIDDEARVREQMDAYRRIGFPPNAGMIAGGFLLRRHNKPHLEAFGDAWFAHVLRFSKRDQLSFPFLARELKLSHTVLDVDFISNAWFVWESKDRLPYGFAPDIYLWLSPDVARDGVDPAKHYRAYGKTEGRPLRYHKPIELDRLANKYKSDKGRLYYNRHFYTRVYEHFLSGMSRDEFTLFEIGLLRHDLQARNPEGPFHEAPSLWMWSEYFPNAQIHGFDPQDLSSVEGGRITVTRGDQSDRAALANAMLKNRHALRVAIDDGSHASHHQQTALGLVFRQLAPNGLYFIEDLNYQPPSLELPNVQKTRDMLRNMQAGVPIRSEFIDPEDMSYLRQNIASIQFFDSMDYASPSVGADSLAVLRKR
jgi:hypothetical protein